MPIIVIRQKPMAICITEAMLGDKHMRRKASHIKRAMRYGKEERGLYASPRVYVGWSHATRSLSGDGDENLKGTRVRAENTAWI